MRKFHLLFVAALLCNDMVIAQETDAGTSTTKTPVSRYSEPLVTVLKKIHQQYNINCLYEEKVVNGKYLLFTKQMQKEKDPERLLRTLLAPLNLDVVKLDDKNFSIIALKRNVVTVTPVSNTSSLEPALQIVTPVAAYTNYKTPASPADTIIKGRIVDEKSEPLAGASISIKGTRIGTTTDKFGVFTLKVSIDAKTLVIEHIGFKSAEVPIDRNNALTIKMAVLNKAMEDVIVTGLYTRKVESFTGAASVFTAAQLKSISNQNIVQSLRTLDPGFLVIENNTLGSNPNALPNLEIRGKTSVVGIKDAYTQDPNQPLFILDGFETDLRTIMDLDINRVNTVTILKDAASTALYGSRAANGVVVIETKRPKVGKLNVSFAYDNTVEMPDLSGYNLMNAAEKLEFEKLSGKYTILKYLSGNPAYQVGLDTLYNNKLNAVLRGVDTYWMNEPLRVGLHNNFSLYVDGGDKNVTYGAGIKYGRINGVMKGSGRDVINANIDLGYRTSKFNLSNKLFISTYKQDESPYGSFTNWANANPYYEKLPGTYKYLEQSDYFFGSITASNPMYEASLGNYNKERQISIREQLGMSYQLLPELKLEARGSLTKTNTETEIFVNPRSFKFDTVDATRRGSYKHQRNDYLMYEAYLQASYGKVFNGIHEVNILPGFKFGGRRTVIDDYTATGFASGIVTSPAFASAYPETGKPVFGRSVSRDVSGYLNMHYGLLSKYLVDFNYRRDGSSVFGSNRRFGNFWTVGLAWNLHNESFFKQFTWFNQFKIRASIGNPGNQSFSTYNSTTTYTYNTITNNQFGLGALVNKYGNPNLNWQQTLEKNLGADINMFNGRFSLRVSYYHKYTDPLVVTVDNAASTGETTNTTNSGTQTTKGVEFQVSTTALSIPEKRLYLRFNVQGTTLKSTFNNFGPLLESVNKQNAGSRSLLRYYDGGSPDDMWAVQSLGIDPATGRELLQRKNGEVGFVYDVRDAVKVGNSRADLIGVAGTSLQWGGFNIGLNLKYSFGGDVFNDALLNKVENITTAGLSRNQDKRALYDRWQKPGDVAPFKKIQLNDGWSGQPAADLTLPTSRFIQKENFITGEAISIGYQFNNEWVSKYGLSSLQVSGYMNDLFRISTIKSERGTDYPFSRSVGFSIRTNF